MILEFYKYHGTGNDFVVVDNRKSFFPKNDCDYVRYICNRRFGVGSDGLILLEESDNYDFKMIYYNSDGKEGSMCGNGGRCLVAFAHKVGVVGTRAKFESVDGVHYAEVDGNMIRLGMNDVFQIEQRGANAYFLDTGSPHHVEFVSDVSAVDVVKRGQKIRGGTPYFEKGTNVNFIQRLDIDTIKLRTYERGVEGETFSCGTGAIAAVIASGMHYSDCSIRKVQVVGGSLQVDYNNNQDGFFDIYLSGKALFVFKGEIV